MDFEQDSEHFKVLMDVVAWKINKLSLFFSFSQFWAFYVFLFQFKYELWAKYWNKMLVNQNASHHTVKKQYSSMAIVFLKKQTSREPDSPFRKQYSPIVLLQNQTAREPISYASSRRKHYIHTLTTEPDCR